jgi:hypothetical protein
MVQDAAAECDDFQVAILMKWTECKKDSISSKIQFHIRLPLPKKLHLSIGLPGKQLQPCDRDRK